MSGALFLIGIFIGDPFVGLLAILGVVSATAFAYYLKLDADLTASGIWGYNGSLVGCALGVFYWGNDGPDTVEDLKVLVPTVLMAMASVVLCMSLARVLVPNFGIVPLTFPFQLATWSWLLGAQRWSNFTPGHGIQPALAQLSLTDNTNASQPAVDAALLAEGILSGVSQTFLVSHWGAGACMLAGIAACSPISAMWGLVGSAAGSLLALALGASHDAVYAGLHGYNAALSAIAIGGFFVIQDDCRSTVLTLFAVVLTSVATDAVGSLLAPVGLPALTFPFTATVWARRHPRAPAALAFFAVLLNGGGLRFLVAVAWP